MRIVYCQSNKMSRTNAALVSESGMNKAGVTKFDHNYATARLISRWLRDFALSFQKSKDVIPGTAKPTTMSGPLNLFTDATFQMNTRSSFCTEIVLLSGWLTVLGS